MWYSEFFRKTAQTSLPGAITSLYQQRLETKIQALPQFILTRLWFQPTSTRLRLDLKSSNISACESNAVICDSVDEDDDAYPADAITTTLSTHVAFKKAEFFEKLFGDVCDDEEVGVRVFEVEATNLCSAAQRYIYPKKAKLRSDWFYIVNTGINGQNVGSFMPRKSD